MTGSFQVRTLRGLSVPVLFSLPLTACFIHLFGFKQMYRFAGRLARLVSRWRPLPARPTVKAEQITRTVILVNRRLSFYQASCLVESLLLWGILSGYGIDARLCLGVRTITGPLDAHAWVSYRGRVLNDIQRVQTIYATFDLDDLTPGACAK